jgi:hypothetical protein
MDQFTLSDIQRQQVEQWLCGCPGPRGRDLLSALSYNLRRVIELRYGLADGHHYSVEETATVMERTANWVVETESGAIIMIHQFLAPAHGTPGPL